MDRTLNDTSVWLDSYFLKLPIGGKLAYCYAAHLKNPILEDMALAIGQDITVCEDWLEQFRADGRIAETTNG